MKDLEQKKKEVAEKMAPRSKALEKKYGISRVATAKDRKKNPYLSSDSKVYSDKNGKDYK